MVIKENSKSLTVTSDPYVYNSQEKSWILNLLWVFKKDVLSYWPPFNHTWTYVCEFVIVQMGDVIFV